jgi:hypothetical protein
MNTPPVNCTFSIDKQCQEYNLAYVSKNVTTFMKSCPFLQCIDTSTLKLGSAGPLANLHQFTRPQAVLLFKDCFEKSFAFSAIFCGVYSDLLRCLELESYQTFLTDKKCCRHTRLPSCCCEFGRHFSSSCFCVLLWQPYKLRALH